MQIHDALERDNDEDSSGSGYGDGDDEDDIHSNKDKDSRLIKEQTTNTHHSGDGSDHRVDGENTDDDDYIENHEDRAPLPIDGEDDNLYFDNTNNSNIISTSTDNKIASTTTDDEDSQFTFRLLFYSFKFIL